MNTYEWVVEVKAKDRDQAVKVMQSMRCDIPDGVEVRCDYLGELGSKNV